LVNIYGSPWQPEFYNWAFNLPRKGNQLKEKWDNIPTDTDILITHGPAYEYVDKVVGQYENLGCELLTERIKEIKPKIHVCGHIHTGYGYTFDGDTHYINASVLNEQYAYSNKPLTIDWNPITNEIQFI
jgi:Icc-related predicted phosphoesterase